MAGPFLIVVSVLVVLHELAVRHIVHTQYTDVLAEWLPNLCFLGKTLAAGHIPAWNPHVMGGTMFAGDPLHGWMNLSAMVLFTVLRCDLALRAYMMLQPILAGLGIYWFLRAERLSRPASTVGGLVLAVPLAGSSVFGSLYLSASVAWIALLLAAAARSVHARTWAGRLVWCGLTAAAWGQIAAAHTEGLLFGTAALLVYVTPRIAGQVRQGRLSRLSATLLGLALVAALVLVNLAYFLPRIEYLHRTTLGLGYGTLERLSRTFTGQTGGVFSVQLRLTAGWPLRLVLFPGLYLGATALALSFGAWFSEWRWSLGAPFAVFGAACYLLSLDRVAVALVGRTPASSLGSLYLHAPYRFAVGTVVALAVLAGVGVQAWLDASRLRRRLVLLAPGVLVWGVLPVTMGAPGRYLVLPAVAALAGGAALVAAVLRPRVAVIVPVVVAAELCISGLVGQRPGFEAHHSPEHPTAPQLAPLLLRIPYPAVDLRAYTTEGAIAAALSRAAAAGDQTRYLSAYPAGWDPRGYHVHQLPKDWGLMATQRSMIFGLQEAQGYNSDQLARYWEFVRAAEPKTIRYSAGFFRRPLPIALDLLDVGWVVEHADRPPPVTGAKPVVTEGQWQLYRLPSAPGPVSVITSWKVVPDPDRALAAVTATGFRPARQVILERTPGLAISAPTGTTSAQAAPASAVDRRISGDAAVITVSTDRAAIVLVRSTYDPDWRATVDGVPAPVLAADSVDQGIAVPAGYHTIRLFYRDPAIGIGLAASAEAAFGLFGGALALWWAGRRRQGPSEEDPATAVPGERATT